MPINLGFSAKGNTSDASGMYEAILAGASGFKLHEDWGTTPSSIDTCLAFADEHDVQARPDCTPNSYYCSSNS